MKTIGRASKLYQLVHPKSAVAAVLAYDGGIAEEFQRELDESAENPIESKPFELTLSDLRVLYFGWADESPLGGFIIKGQKVIKGSKAEYLLRVDSMLGTQFWKLMGEDMKDCLLIAESPVELVNLLDEVLHADAAGQWQ